MPVQTPAAALSRRRTSPGPPAVRGKFLFVGAEILRQGDHLRPLPPRAGRLAHAGSEYHTPDRVEARLAQMAASGYNAVRCYTVPPRGCWTSPCATACG